MRAFLRLTALFLTLCLLPLPAAAQEAPRIIAMTVYRQMGWGDRVEIGCIDDEGGLWTLTGSASVLGWPYGPQEQLRYLSAAERLEPAGKLDFGQLFNIQSLVAAVQEQEPVYAQTALDAGVESSWAVRYDRDGAARPLLIGCSGDDTFENTSPAAQALYADLHALFPGVTCYGGDMGPQGFRPVPVAEFLGWEDVDLTGAAIRCYDDDCEAGPVELEIDGALEAALRGIAENGVVTGMVSAVSTTGGTVSCVFVDENGEYLASFTLYEGLLVGPGGMYRLAEAPEGSDITEN